MNPNKLVYSIVKSFLIIAGLVALFNLIIISKPLIGYISLSIVVSLIGRPIKNLLVNKVKMNHLFSTIITLFFLITVFFVISSLIFPVLATQAQSLSLLQIDDLEKKIILLVKELNMFFSTYNINLSNEISSILKSFDFSFLTDFLNGFLSFLGDSTITLFSVIFISFFLLKDSSLLLRVIIIISPETEKLKVKKSFEKVVILLSRYFNGLLLQITILFIFYSLILLIFGVKNAVTIALICALLNIIPYLGPLIGGFLITFLTLTTNLGLDIGSSVLPKTLGVFMGFCVGQLIDNFISQPYIFSKSVKSHPLEIFIIIILAGLIAGALGMLIAVPLYTVLKVILSEFFQDNRIVKELTKNM